MPDAVEHARSPKAKRFAEDMCRRSLRPSWRPTTGQRKYMGFIVMDLEMKEDEDFELFEPVTD